MSASEAIEGPAASWKRARRRYLRVARDPDSAHVAFMQLVVSYAMARGYDQHFHAYTLPDFLAISTAQFPDEALTTPFLSISVSRDGVFDLSLVSPASAAPVIPCRALQASLFHELDACFAALSSLLVEHAQKDP